MTIRKTKKSKEVLDGEVISLASDLTTLPIDVTNIEPEDDNIEIFGEYQNQSLTMYLDKNVDSKFFIKFVKAVEKMVRGNDDYKLWLSSIREEPKLSQDAFLYNVGSNVAEIQVHHFPFNLFNIVRNVTDQYLYEGKKVSTFIIADKVIQLHFQGLIGLVPLSVTMHEIAHLGKLTFVRTQIFGEWEEYYEAYKEYMDEYEHTVIQKLLATDCLEMSDQDITMLGYTEASSSSGTIDDEFDDNIEVEE